MVHIPRRAEKRPNFPILNSLFTISILYPPLLSLLLLTRQVGKRQALQRRSLEIEQRRIPLRLRLWE
jgi:hypothetical protein